MSVPEFDLVSDLISDSDYESDTNTNTKPHLQPHHLLRQRAECSCCSYTEDKPCMCGCHYRLPTHICLCRLDACVIIRRNAQNAINIRFENDKIVNQARHAQN
jgi:hypothetical protein